VLTRREPAPARGGGAGPRGAAASGAAAIAPPACLLCGARRHRTVFREHGVDILRCRGCRHVFSSFPADPHYDGFWGDHVPDGPHVYWSAARRRMHEDFAARFLVGRAGRLLDMGTGLGFFLKTVVSHPGWEAFGCEISPAAVLYARERLGLGHVRCGPPEAVDLPRDSFDIVTLWDVLEHVPAPDRLLSHCRALLRPGGICFIRTPNVTVQLLRARLLRAVVGVRPGRAYLQARDHLHHYSMSGVRRLLARNGLADVRFVHLRPIQGTRRGAVAKTAWYQLGRALWFLSAGRCNIDNLFVVARKAER
jgi:SAM-dependent methyltransferase